jgi:hypothetical protein
VLPHTLDLSVEQLVEAAQKWGNLPIRREDGPA